MRICKMCEEPAKKGYSRDPLTGQNSKDFYCDECFERGMQRTAQTIANNQNQAENTKERVARRRGKIR